MQEICSFQRLKFHYTFCYLQVGRKRAPNFDADRRQLVFLVFEKYEREKLRLNRSAYAAVCFGVHKMLSVKTSKSDMLHALQI